MGGSLSVARRTLGDNGEKSLIEARNALLITFAIWLNEKIDDAAVYIDGYSIARCDRINKLGGGVCAFIKSDILLCTVIYSGTVKCKISGLPVHSNFKRAILAPKMGPKF